VSAEGIPEVPSLSRRVTQEGIRRYAEASGDYNPIHVDEEYARATPFGGTIAHGMLVLAYLSEMMAAAFGHDWLAGGRLKARFRAPARPGDTLTARAEPRQARLPACRTGRPDGQARQVSGDRVYEYGIECCNQRGETLVSGTAEVVVARSR
jgi:3-hydroxybutyryl-CoA dehydratase